MSANHVSTIIHLTIEDIVDGLMKVAGTQQGRQADLHFVPHAEACLLFGYNDSFLMQFTFSLNVVRGFCCIYNIITPQYLNLF